MLKVTEQAAKKLQEYLSANRIEAAVRVAYKGGG